MAGLVVSRILPGPPGAPGAAGAAATSGINAFTETTAAFLMPAVGGNVTVDVLESGWMSPNGVPASGQIVHLQNAGYMLVVTLVDSTHVTLQNPTGYTPGNATAATNIPSGSKVSAGGVKGVDGATGAAPLLNDISPTTTKGDILVDDGANAPASSVIRMTAGTNGHVLHSDSTQASGRRTGAIDLTGVNTVLTGDLPVAEGGTGASNAAGAATNLSVLPLSGGTLTGDLKISSSSPELWLNETGATADNQKWQWSVDAERLELNIHNDAESSVSNVLRIERTGVTVDDVGFTNGKVSPLNLRVLGELCAQQLIDNSLANGNNNDVDFSGGTFIKIGIGPTAAFAITGLDPGTVNANGRILILFNATGQNMTLSHEDILSVVSKRITSTTGASVVTTGNGTAVLIYSSDDQRWIIISSTA